MLKTWSFWKIFFISYLSLVAGIKAFVEAVIYFSGDSLKPLLGSNGWILALVLPLFVAPVVAWLNLAEGKTQAETLDQHNRRLMLNHVENGPVKSNLEDSLHRVALREIGIKENPNALRYPWTIKQESTGKTLPADKSMLAIFEEIGFGRSLLILGNPGSGKTIMLMELARQLIERARGDETEPIPVVFNLGSWKESQTLIDWLAEQLNIHYSVPKKTAPAWIHENRMLLLLDGLDEVKQESRGKCVHAINQFRKERGLTSLVICSRSEEFRAIDAKLSYEGAITLQPLTSEQINAYFDLFGKNLAFVKKVLKKDKSLQELAESPLMLSTMALAYKNIEIGQMQASKNVEEQRRNLFDTYIEHMFQRSTRITNSALTKLQTTHYLSWLARKMLQHNAIPYQLEVMQPSWLDEKLRRLHRLFSALIFGPCFGLAMGLLIVLGFELIWGLISGLIAGLIMALLFWWSSEEITMLDKLKWSWKEARQGVGAGLIYGSIGGLIVALFIMQTDGLIDGLSIALGVMVFSMLVLMVITGLISEQVAETTYPGQRLKQTVRNTFYFIVLSGLLGGLSFGLIGVLLDDPLIFASLGMLCGGVCGLLFGTGPALLRHFALRVILARYQLLPWRLIPFLEHAVDLIFLRRTGGSYIFVHRTLMEHFAKMDV
jgi:hypothetical protein